MSADVSPLTQPSSSDQPLSRPSSPSASLRAPKPNPLMLEVADRNGEPHPALKDQAELLNLDPDTLVPRWWPHQMEGHSLTPAERASVFAENLEVAFRTLHPSSSQPDSATSTSASPTTESSRPQQVLASLRLLHSGQPPETTPTRD